MKIYRPTKRFLLSLFFALLMTPLLMSDNLINNILGYVFIGFFVLVFIFGYTRYFKFDDEGFKTNFRMKRVMKTKQQKKNSFLFSEINITKFEEHGQSMRKIKVFTIILKNKDKYIFNLSSFTDDQYEEIKSNFKK